MPVITLNDSKQTLPADLASSSYDGPWFDGSDVWYYSAAVGIWQEKQQQGNFLCSEKLVVFFRSIGEYNTNDSNPCLF